MLSTTLCIWSAPGQAKADKQRAGEFFKEGNTLYAGGHYPAALEKYQQARALISSYKLDLNIAFCLLELGRLAEAATELERFLGQATEAPSETVILARKRLDAVRGKLASVKVRCSAEGVSLKVDGQPRGGCLLKGTRIYLRPGEHHVSATLEGHQPFEWEASLKAGDHHDLQVQLQPKPAPPPPATAPALAAGAGVARPGLQSPPREVPAADTHSRRRSRTIWAWTTLGVGAALAVAAAALYGVGISGGDEAHSKYTEAAGKNPPAPETEINGYYGDIEAARTQVLAGNILIGATAVAAGISIYLFLTRSAATAGEPAAGRVTRAGLTPLPGGRIAH